MCGLVGVMKNNMSLGYIQKFKDLMAVAQIRGDDGSGIMSVPKGNADEEIKHVNVRRCTWSSGHLVTLKEFDDVVKGDRSILAGHARQPTRGASTIENVHPHRSENIILMHNGTMSHVGGTHITAGNSDSKAIAKYLTDHTPQEFVQTSYGAYALVWIDLTKQTLNFLRNGERTLWFASDHFSSKENSATEALWWASEAPFIQLVLSRYVGYAKDRIKYFPLPKDEHWSFPLNVSPFIADATVEKCEKKYPITNYTGHDYGYGHWWDAIGDEDQTPRPPFNHRASNQNTSGNLPAASSAVSGGTTKPDTASKPFVYIPPEQREQHTTTSISMLVHESKRKALENAAKNDKKTIAPGGGATTFPEKVNSLLGGAKVLSLPEKSIQDFACRDLKRLRSLITSSACVWCNVRPLFKEGKPPLIYPVRHTDNRNDYVCDGCIADDDIQRAFGF